MADIPEPLRPFIIDAPFLDISATEVRARRAAGRPCADLLGEAVSAYVESHDLYR